MFTLPTRIELAEKFACALMTIDQVYRPTFEGDENAFRKLRSIPDLIRDAFEYADEFIKQAAESKRSIPPPLPPPLPPTIPPRIS